MAITFDNIAGGELAEKFRIALAQIGRNIMDPNMDPDGAREMNIKLKFEPSESGSIQVMYDIKTKLASFKKAKTTFLIGQDVKSGRIEISEYNNNRPSYQAVQAVTAEPKPAAPGDQSPYDPETGESLEAKNQKPIDLRASN